MEVMAAVGSWCGGVSRLSLLPTHPSQADVQSRILDEATVEGRGDGMKWYQRRPRWVGRFIPRLGRHLGFDHGVGGVWIILPTRRRV